MTIVFISKDACWQKYRNDILAKLSNRYQADVQVLTTGQLQDFVQPNGAVTYFLFKNLLPFFSRISFFPGALWHIIRHRPHAVLALTNVTQLTEYAACLLCKVLNIRFVWWTHGYDHDPSKYVFLSRLKEKYVLLFLKVADGIITFSQAGEKYLISRGIDGRRIRTAPNTLDTERLIALFQHVRKTISPTNFRLKHGISPDTAVFIFTGRLKPEKKLSHAIEALSLLQNQVENVRLIIIGDGENLETLRAAARELEIENHVMFAGAIYDDELLAEWLTLSDAMIVPAYAGLVIVHAFCFGLPVITTYDNTHGPEFEYIKSDFNSLVVEPNDPVALAEAMIRIIKQKNLLANLKSNALYTASTNASISRMITAMSHVLELN
ncbi:glycosyltransferase family 4 protein [candidate division KSB1 bacterium]|nr:glycosyltransferase family 4 protein [candidate division KSB1 bacterium]